MRFFFKTLASVMAIIFSFVLIFCIYGFFYLPSKYIVTSDDSNISINTFLNVKDPPGSKFKNTAEPVSYINNKFSINKNTVKNIFLLNIFPIKQVNVQFLTEQKILPCGIPFGVKIFTQGVLVIGTSDVKSKDGLSSPAKNSGIKKGDVILSVDNKSVNTNEDLFSIVKNSSGNVLSFEVLRNNSKFFVNIRPIKDLLDETYKLGAWVRDSSAGIGTLTFQSPETNIFGGLGHGICDVDTGDLLQLLHGDIVKANISGIVKGRKGAPGELKGYFIETEPIGKLLKNTDYGVYGTLKDSVVETMPIAVAPKQDIKIGAAEIATTVDGMSPKYYRINIQNISYNENSPCKNMIIKITDDTLLQKTGGIIQGMSGSPIIQNGRLVGAVTHVFINDPSKGYAIFAENMVYGTEFFTKSNTFEKAS